MREDQSWQEVARAWQNDGVFRKSFASDLAAKLHEAFAWESAPVSGPTRDRPYTYVVTDSPALARVTANPTPFAAHFDDAQDGICTFTNLGGDATLVVPSPRSAQANYAHLAAFLRSAPPTQIEALWVAVGRAVERWWAASDAPVWVSTAGLGVHWLHVRLDARPKYYRHVPYRRFVGL